MPEIKVQPESEDQADKHSSLLEEQDGYLSDSSSSTSDEEDRDGDEETEEVESPGGISLHLPSSPKYPGTIFLFEGEVYL